MNHTVTVTVASPTSPVLANSSFAGMDYFNIRSRTRTRTSSSSSSRGSFYGTGKSTMDVGTNSTSGSGSGSGSGSPYNNSIMTSRAFNISSPILTSRSATFSSNSNRNSTYSSGSNSVSSTFLPFKQPKSRAATPSICQPSGSSTSTPTNHFVDASSTSYSPVEPYQNPAQMTPSRSFSKRRSIRILEKANVNWARPLRIMSNPVIEESRKPNSDLLELGPVSVPIFGTSSQRSRRLDRRTSSSVSPELPSPTTSDSPSHGGLTSDSISSSEDERLPCTPHSRSNDTSRRPSAEWNVITDDRRGLGIGILEESDWLTSSHSVSESRAKNLPSTSQTSTPVHENHDPFNSSPASSIFTASSGLEAQLRTPPTSISTLPSLASIQSLDSYTSTMTLAELRSLRRAAADMAEEARGSYRPMSIVLDEMNHLDVVTKRPAPTATPERESKSLRTGLTKIKRKAVPAIYTIDFTPPEEFNLDLVHEIENLAISEAPIAVQLSTTPPSHAIHKASFSDTGPSPSNERRIVSSPTTSTRLSSSSDSSFIQESTQTSEVITVKTVPREWMLKFNHPPSPSSNDNEVEASLKSRNLFKLGKDKGETSGYLTRSRSLALRSNNEERGDLISGKQRRGLSRFLGRKREENGAVEVD